MTQFGFLSLYFSQFLYAQVERKRHLGNDIILIIFRDADCVGPFDPLIIKYVQTCIITTQLNKHSLSKTYTPHHPIPFLYRSQFNHICTHHNKHDAHALPICTFSFISSFLFFIGANSTHHNKHDDTHCPMILFSFVSLSLFLI